MHASEKEVGSTGHQGMEEWPQGTNEGQVVRGWVSVFREVSLCTSTAKGKWKPGIEAL